MKKFYLLCLLFGFLSVHAQNQFEGWPSTGIELIESGDLPVIGKINNKTIFYFNLNEDGWDSVYTHENGYYKVKINSNGGYKRQFNLRNYNDSREVELISPAHHVYESYTVKNMDSTHRTFYPNGNLKSRYIYSKRGYGVFEASELHDRYVDVYRTNDGIHTIDFVKDTIIHGYEAIVSAKINDGDTSLYEIKEPNGKVWKYVGEMDSVDYKIINERDTMFQIRRLKYTQHLWWHADSIIDTTWARNGTMWITKNSRFAVKDTSGKDTTGAQRHCGTNYVRGIKKLFNEFTVVIDSVLGENGKIESINESELILRVYEGWVNWPTMVKTIQKGLYPKFNNERRSIKMSWDKDDREIKFVLAEDEYNTSWKTSPEFLKTGDVKYQAIEWNGNSGESIACSAIYFHLEKKKL